MEISNPFRAEPVPAPTTVDMDELQRRELVAQDRIQQAFAKLVGDGFLPVLAMAPYIPLEVAEIQEFPNLEKMVNDRMVQTGPGPSVWKKPIMWMERPAGESALSNLRARRPREYLRVVTHSLSRFGQITREFSEPPLAGDPTLRRFTLLAASCEAPDKFLSLLRSEVEKAIRQSEVLGLLWSPEARAWIEAAEPFGAVLEGGFYAAVAAAKRRFELFHRRAHDRARLRTYFPRDVLDRVFLDHLKDEKQWALHLMGAGGTGKTMLIRHLAITVAEEQKNIAVSRIDFDYLNPQYPERDPLLLLKALAEEFRLDQSTDSVRAFAEFDSASDVVYRRLEEAARAGENLRSSLKDEDVQRAIQAFAEGLATLSHAAQPVLILDTCEELAKAQPGQAVPRNVQHTMDLLETVYRAYLNASTSSRGLRIVFSGRRALPALPHLKVYRLHGFSKQEALDFLTSYSTPAGRRVPPALIPGILDLTEDKDGHSPYDLDTYAAWAAVDERLTKEKLETAGPLLYIQERIVDRLTPTVRRIFPALATMGRFDNEIVARLIGPTENPTADLAEVLSQEWVHADSAGAADTWRLEDLFCQRVLKFYKVEAGARQEARDRLAEILPPLTRTRPFDVLTPQLIAACLDVLTDTPPRAAAWWEEMEARIADEAEWQWADQLMTFLEADPQEEPGPMTAALFATKAAVMLHSGQDPTSAWQVVEKHWEEHPEPKGQRRLRWRAACAIGTPRAADFPQSPSTQDQASLLAYLERADWPQTDHLRLRMDPLELRAYRALLGCTKGVPTGGCFDEALALCRDHPFEPRQTWLDWIHPANLTHRALLEFAFRAPDEFPGKHGDLLQQLFAGPLASIDSDRLASAWLRLEEKKLALAANPNARQFRDLHASSVALVAQEPACAAHQAFPPFFITLLEARGMSGDLEPVRVEINRLSGKDAALPAGTKRELDKVLLRLIVRFRLTSEGIKIPGKVDPLREEIAAAFQTPVEGALDLTPSEDALEAAEILFLSGGHPEIEGAFDAAVSRQDDPAALEARMLAALSFARRGDREAARREARFVQRFYERLNNAPGWPEIEFAATSHNMAFVLDAMGTKPVVWRPWVVRILACLTTQPDALVRWLLANDVTVVDGVPRLATELEFLRADAPAAAAEAPAPPPAARPASRLRTAIFFVVGMMIIGACVWALYFGYTFVLSQTGITLSRNWRLLSFFIVVPTVITLASQVPRIFALMLDAYARSIQARSSVTAEQDPSDPYRPLLVPTVWTSRVVFLNRFPMGTTTRNMSATSKERYRDILLELLPDYRANSIALSFLRLIPRLHFRSELTLDQRTVPGPWEALMGPNKIIAIRRVTRERRLSILPDWTAPVEVLTWGGNNLYTMRRDWGTQFHASFAQSPRQFNESNPKVGVLRILAKPVESATGPRLMVGGDSPSFSASNAYPSTRHASQAPDSVASPPPAYSVQGADFAALYPGLRLCIVQCPTAEIARRLSSDRRNAAILKQIGAEIFSAGVPIVIVIPVLPERASEALIDEIYRILGSRPYNAVPLLEAALMAFRRKPPAPIAQDPDDTEEIVQDICLYAPDSVSFKITP